MDHQSKALLDSLSESFGTKVLRFLWALTKISVVLYLFAFFAISKTNEIYMHGAQAGYEQGYTNGYAEGKKSAVTLLTETI